MAGPLGMNLSPQGPTSPEAPVVQLPTPQQQQVQQEQEKQGFFRKLFSGPSLMGMGLAASFGANPLMGLLVAAPLYEHARETAKRGNEDRRYLLDQRQARMDAISGLPGLLSSDPQQQQALGLFAQGFPEKFAQGAQGQLFPGQQGRADPADIRTLDLLGLERTPENFQQLQNWKRSGDSDVQATLAQLQLLAEQRQLQEDIDRSNRESEERTAQRRTERNTLVSSGRNLLRAAEINQELMNFDGSMIEKLITAQGLPFEEGRRTVAGISAQFGNENLNRATALIDEWDSLIPEIAIDRIDTAGFDAGTNTRFNAFLETKPSRDKVGSANTATIIRNLEAAILADDAKGLLTPEERMELMNGLTQLKAMQSTPQAPSGNQSKIDAAREAIRRAREDANP